MAMTSMERYQKMLSLEPFADRDEMPVFPMLLASYGSIGGVIVVLLWLYLTACTLIMGAEFNSVLLELRSGHGARPMRDTMRGGQTL